MSQKSIIFTSPELKRRTNQRSLEDETNVQHCSCWDDGPAEQVKGGPAGGQPEVWSSRKDVARPAGRKVWRAGVREDKFSKALWGGVQKEWGGEMLKEVLMLTSEVWQRGCDADESLEKQPGGFRGGWRRAARTWTRSRRICFITGRVREDRGGDKQMEQLRTTGGLPLSVLCFFPLHLKTITMFSFLLQGYQEDWKWPFCRVWLMSKSRERNQSETQVNLLLICLL